MSSPKLRHSPYAIFENSQSPPGLYARQKWLNQGETETYRADFAAAVAKLRYADMNPGSRSELILGKLHRLFGLHLTVRNADRFLETALNEVIGENKVRSQQIESVLVPDRLNGLPFAATRWDFFIGPASLFLAAIFGKATDPGVDPIYAQLAANVTDSSAFRSDAAAMHNALRALVVHPDDRFRPALDQTIKVPLTFTAPQTLRTGPGSLGLDGVISGDAALAKTGNGTLLLNATNRFTGTLAVQEGALSINGVLSNGSLSIANATLAGTGRVHGPVLILDGGNLDPGSSGLGTLAINGPLTLRGDVTMQISKSGTNCLSDSIAGISALSYGRTLNVALLTGPLAANHQFTLFSATAYAGVFVNLNLPAPGTGLFWDTSALSTSGTIVVRRINSPTFGRLSFIWDVSPAQILSHTWPPLLCLGHHGSRTELRPRRLGAAR